MPKAWGPELHVSVEIRAPRDFVFAWCTDFDPNDAALEKESYHRRVLEKGPRRVVFEDLDEGPSGWYWARHVVSLRPPSRWHSESIGNYRDARLDYVLTSLGPERTRLDLRWRRRPTAIAPRPPSKATIERGSTRGWKHYAAALEREYRAGRPPRRARR